MWPVVILIFLNLCDLQQYLDMDINLPASKVSDIVSSILKR